MSATNKELVLRKRPSARLFAWKDSYSIYTDHPHPAIGSSASEHVGNGKTPALAWADAAKTLKGKRTRQPRSIAERRVVTLTHRQEARRRAIQRRILCQRVGTVILNSLENGGSLGFKDYTRLDPRWLLGLYRRSK